MKNNKISKKEDFDIKIFVNNLLKKYSISEYNISYEYPLKKDNDSFFLADAVILDEKKHPLILIEIKRSIDTSLTISNFQNLLKQTKCLFGVVSDGTKFVYFKNDKKNEKIEQISDLPNLKESEINKTSKLRAFQQEAINKITSSFEKEKNKLLVYLMQGSGKTLLFYNLIKELKERNKIKNALWLTDRIEFLNQITLTIKQFNDLPIKTIKNKIDNLSLVNTSTIQTMEVIHENFKSDDFDLIILDYSNPFSIKRKKILDYFNKSKMIYVTSNIEEKENIEVREFFGKPVFEYSLKEAIQDGEINPFTVKELVPLMDTSDILYKMFDILRNELDTYQSFHEIIKIIMCKIYDEKNNRPELKFQLLRNEIVHNSYNNIKNVINNLLEDIFKKSKVDIEPTINIKEDSLAKIILLLQGIALIDYNGELIDKDLFEKLYSRIKDISPKSLGEFYTPINLTNMIIKLLSIKEDDIIANINCGTGDILKELIKIVPPGKIYGFEKNKSLISILNNRFFVSSSKINLYTEDIIDEFKESFNKIITIPPFGGILRVKDRNIQYDVYILEKALKTIKKDGLILAVLPDGSLFKKDKEHIYLRNLLKNNYQIISIISLPSGVFSPYTMIKTNILIIKNSKPTKNNKTIMTNLESLDEKDYLRIINVLNKSKFEEDDKLFLINQNELNENDFNVKSYIPSFNKEMDRITKNVETVKLSQVAEIIKGVHISSNQYSNEGIRVIQIKDIDQNKLSDLNPKFINKKDIQNKDSLTINNDILIGTSGTIGKICKINKNEEGYLVSSSLTIIRANSNNNQPNKFIIDKEYLYYILQSYFVKEQLDRITFGDFIKNISVKDLKEIIIPYPPIAQKLEISNRMNELEKKLEEAEKAKEDVKNKMEALKKNMHRMIFQ